LLSRAEHGEEILITRGKAVAFLGSYHPPLMTKKAIQRAIDVMAKGVSWEDTLQRFNREEMQSGNG